jgi:hypothetical protein
VDLPTTFFGLLALPSRAFQAPYPQAHLRYRQHQTMDRISVDGQNVSQDRLSAYENPKPLDSFEDFHYCLPPKIGGKPFAVI